MESPRDNNTRGESYKDIAQRPDSDIVSHVRSLFPGARRDHKASLHNITYTILRTIFRQYFKIFPFSSNPETKRLSAFVSSISSLTILLATNIM